jgi:predicted nucleotidyltransferase
MIDISTWTDQFLQALQHNFKDRVWFVGLQGSYGRGEATETSDIDMVVILDEVNAADLAAYHAMLDQLPYRELLCGFLSGKQEILNWDAADLFQLYHDTTPIVGSLDEVLERIDGAAVNRAIKLGVCNLYHGCVHNILYDHSEDILKGLYKGASFVVQAIVFQETGRYFRHQTDLRQAVSPEERSILDTFLHLKNGGAVDFANMSETLFTWCKHWIERT